ncbi:hypothetical protein [Roseinatronobacter sp.]|uniref:hypothetical protein n=1 Tax=Roseinatronobacter sp. TaxID=1945755 RepID=UPI003F6F096E
MDKGAQKLALLDIKHPFFRPLWRRVVVTLICFVWAGVEFAVGSPMFGILSGALGAWCFYQLFWRFDPAAFGDEKTTSGLERDEISLKHILR